MNGPVRTLITNDDGIRSPGLLRLAQAAVEAGLDVVVAAPAAEASGSSAAITAFETDGRIEFERRELEGLDGVEAYAVRAAPALIALLAGHGSFGPAPDLVLSGVNRGVNVGRAILHSGTVGAALTGGVNGARGLAVSLQIRPDASEPPWDVASRLASGLIPLLLEQPVGTVFNLNVPDAPDAPDPGRLPEYRLATLASFGIVHTTMTERGEGFLRLAVADPTDPVTPGSDAELLAAGHATVTAIDSVAETRLDELERGLAGIRPR